MDSMGRGNEFPMNFHRDQPESYSQSAWKVNSANFAMAEFSEVRMHDPA